MRSLSLMFCAMACFFPALTGTCFSQFGNVIDVPPDPAPTAIASDTQLNVFANGSLPIFFEAGDANSTNIEVNLFDGFVGGNTCFNRNVVFNVTGGFVSPGANINSGCEVNLEGGSISHCYVHDGGTVNVRSGDLFNFNGFTGSVVNLEGGTIGNGADINEGAIFNMNSGDLGDRFEVRTMGEANISGGVIGQDFEVFDSGTANISGGVFGDAFQARTNSNIFLHGTSFELRNIQTGELVMDLTPNLQAGMPTLVPNRDVALTGVFLDGSSFSFDLNASQTLNEDFFSASANLYVILEQGGTAGNSPPLGYQVFRGVDLGSTLSDFANADDVRGRFGPGFVLNGAEAPVWLVFEFNENATTGILVESNANTPGISYTVEGFNWGTSSFEVIGQQPESFNNDQTLTFNTNSSHIASNGDVRARIGWRRTGFTIQFPWQVRVDQVNASF